MANRVEMTVNPDKASVSMTDPQNFKVPGYKSKHANIIDENRDRSVDFIVLDGDDLGEERRLFVFANKDSYEDFCSETSQQKSINSPCHANNQKHIIYEEKLIHTANKTLTSYYEKAGNFLKNTLRGLLKGACSKNLKISEGDKLIKLDYQKNDGFHYFHHFDSKPDGMNVFLTGLKEYSRKCSETK